jgi:outer membrane autotransporter protein
MGGALTFPAGSTLTLTASGDNTYGQILAPGEAVSLTSGLTINVNVPNTATFSGSPLQVISGAGASGNTVLVNSLNPRYSFTALNNSSDPAGHSTSNNVLLFPAIVAALPPASPAAGAGNAFNAALPGATGDLLLVQSLVSALGSLAAIAAAQEQFAPIVNGDNAMMSLQVLDSFQNRWQTNLLRARGADICYDRFDPAGCPTVCNPCSGSGRANAWNGEGFWADVFAYGADQHTRQRIEGYDAQTFGVMGAWQQRIYEHWQAGLGLGYAHTHVSGDAGQIAANHLNINTVEATAFLGYNKGPWFLDSFFTTDWNDYDGYRHIVFAGVDRVASSDYDGQGYSLLFSGGYNFYFGKVFTITPLASIQFQKLHIDGYTESGAGALDLVQESQHYNVIESGLGVMLGSGFMPIENCCSILNSEVHAIWYYDLETFLYRNTSYFSGGGPAFDTIGTRPGRSKLDLGISSTIFTARGLSLQLGYDAYFRSNYIGQEGNLSISYRI